MRKVNALLVLFLILIFQSSIGQSELSPQIQELMEELISETDNESEASAIYEHLEALIQNPYEINRVSKEQLENLLIVSDFQIYTFLEYRDKYGRILSIKELELIPAFNADITQKLKMFLYAGNQAPLAPPYQKNNYSSFRILNRYAISTPARSGFFEENDSLRTFSGGNHYRLLKLRYKLGENISSGITMESDAGEAFGFGNKSYGFDFYSFYFQINSPAKKLNKIILGDFKLISGLGLIHGYGFGSKSSEAIIKQKFTGVKPYTSTAESGFYRGLALKSGFSSYESIVYFSRKKQSAGLNQEEEELSFSSIDISGLHRNFDEKANKNSITEENTGFILSKINNSSRYSYNGEISHFEEPLEYRVFPNRNSQLAKDKYFINQSISFHKIFSKFNISAEIAFDKNFNPALQQIIYAHLHPLLCLSLSYRYFSPKYIALHSKSFAESSGTRNERGFYLGLETFPFRTVVLNAYIDSYRFPWMRYDDTSPYSGTDFIVNVRWIWNRDFYIKAYFKQELFFEKEKSDLPISEMIEAYNTRFFVQTNYDFSENMNFRNKFELKTYHTKDEKKTGYLIYQEVSRKFPDIKLSINLRYTIFDIPHWTTRIYSWEHDLLYSFYTPVFYKTGQNILINIRYTLKNFKLGMKGSFNFYKNEYSGGSGVEKRSGIIFSLMKLQCIYSI